MDSSERDDCEGQLPLHNSGEQPLSYGEKSLSHSSRSTYDTCQRQWYYKYKLNLDSGAETSAALRMGTAYHAAMEHSDINVVTGLYREHYDSGVSFPDKLAYEERIVKTLANLGLDKRDELVAWLEKKYGKCVVEHEVDLHPVRHAFGGVINGRVDCVITTHDGLVCIVDYKLLSQFSKRDADMVKYNPQLLNYATHLSEHRGIIPENILCVYAVARKPGLHHRKGESYAEYTTRSINNIYDEQGKYQQWVRVGDYTQHKFDCFKQDMVQYDKEMMGSERREEEYRRNLKACGEWGGCEFIPICHARSEGAASTVRSAYTPAESAD